MEALVKATGSITCSASGCTDTTDDATVKPPSKKRSVLDRLLGEETQDNELSIEDEVK